jgi:hypothetical protein
MRPYKILSDFDGVWTDQHLEAEVVRDFAAVALAQAVGAAVPAVADDYAAMLREVAAAPHEHGWAPDGRISAYVDEDPLCQCSAICRFIEHDAGAVATRYRAAVAAAGFASMSAFGEHCFVGGTARYRELHPPCIVDDAADMLAAVREGGAEVVVVSNSATEKLVAFFAAAGIHASEAPPQHGDHPAVLRVRGSAGKWFLGPTDETITVGGRAIFVDRPRYRAVIADEQPDLVIGDVFSLDLALPHVMRGRGDAGAPSTLVLRRHHHTPAWIGNSRADGAIDAMVEHVGDLAHVLADARTRRA